MRASADREPDETRQKLAQFTTDLLCIANQLRIAGKSPQGAEDARQQRLEKIRQAIANGSYQIDTSALSKAMIRRRELL